MAIGAHRITMTRDKRIRLSEGEKDLLRTARESLYDESVPYGVIVERACVALLAEQQNGVTL